ncbi:MAG: substrate-binding periplasmic protein [Rhodoferax sp.]
MHGFWHWALALGARVLLLGALCGASLAWAQPPVRMSSLEWPPYTGAQLARQGATTVVVREVLRQAGMELQVGFFPWNRAVDLARRDDGYLAYFPEYYDSANAQQFLYSDPVGSGPLVFAQRRRQPVVWSRYEDLAGKTIGVVRGYLNTEELDARIAQGRLRANEAPDDAKNLLKLASARVDLAVVDANVFHYLARHDPDVRAVADSLELNPRALENKQLYVCFKNTPQGRALRDAFNQALKRVAVDALMRQALAAGQEP